MVEVHASRRVATWMLTACGIWLAALGFYFMVLRPPLLPEDLRFMGTTFAAIRAAAPGFEAWLQTVFFVMGGFMAGAGVLTVFVATVAMPLRLRGTASAIALSGVATVATMSAANFVLHSDYRWLLLMPVLIWLAGLSVYVARKQPNSSADRPPYALHAESSLFIEAPPHALFTLLDDHQRLASHMSKSSWMMAGSSMSISTDAAHGQEVGSSIRLSGKVLGIELNVDEVVTRREPPWSKTWATIGVPRLLVMGSYAMGFVIADHRGGALLRIFIDYNLPTAGAGRWLGKLFGNAYAKWCTTRMATDAAALSRAAHPAST
jgi:hypothetical protein